MTAFVVGLIAPASAQKAEIEAVLRNGSNSSIRAISLALHRSTPLMRPHSRRALQWYRAEPPLGQCSKAWRKELAIRN